MEAAASEAASEAAAAAAAAQLQLQAAVSKSRSPRSTDKRAPRAQLTSTRPVPLTVLDSGRR
jgi:hypothetical protein